MKKKLSVLWVCGPFGSTLHRKREYGAKSRTLCGFRVGARWQHLTGGMPKCKRCAA